MPPFSRAERSSARSSGSTRPGQARAGRRLHALSVLPAPRGGASRVTHSHPRLGSSAPPRCPRLPPPPPASPPPDPSPPGAPRLPSPHPAPGPGISTTSLRSWRPHVFTGLPVPVDVVLSRSDLQARPPRLPWQHQTGPSCAPSLSAPRRRRVRRPPLSRPRRPRPVQPPPRARRAQPCHPPPKAGAAAARTWASGSTEVRRGRCRQPSPFSRRRRLEPWPPPPACPRSLAQPQDCELEPLTYEAGLRAPALGPDGSPGWDSGHLELMSNWRSAETGSEVSERSGRGVRGGVCVAGGSSGLKGALD